MLKIRTTQNTLIFIINRNFMLIYLMKLHSYIQYYDYINTKLEIYTFYNYNFRKLTALQIAKNIPPQACAKGGRHIQKIAMKRMALAGRAISSRSMRGLKALSEKRSNRSITAGAIMAPAAKDQIRPSSFSAFCAAGRAMTRSRRASAFG